MSKEPIMIPSTTPSTAATAPVDEDLAEQARPGYGIPSQDPRTGAQTALEPEDAEREAHSALMGGGMMAGAAAGAAVGVAVAGPVGVVVGSTLGGIAGALGGAAAGTMVSSDEPLTDAVEGDHLAQSARGPANKRDSK